MLFAWLLVTGVFYYRHNPLLVTNEVNYFSCESNNVGTCLVLGISGTAFLDAASVSSAISSVPGGDIGPYHTSLRQSRLPFYRTQKSTEM